MGRELYLVPLDFNHPLNEIWPGFVNPHFRPCPASLTNDCHGGGTNASEWLYTIARLIALVGSEAASGTPAHLEHYAKTGRIYPHPYLKEWKQAPRTKIPDAVQERLHGLAPHDRYRELGRHLYAHPQRLLTLDPALAVVVQALAGDRDISGPFGADSASAYEIYRSLLKAAKIEDPKWGHCQVCDGEGIDPKMKELYQAWKPTPPPKGDGFQLWTTTNEGAPISPVFSTLETLCAWCETHATTFGSHRASAEQWQEMFTEGLVRHEEKGSDGRPDMVFL